MNDRLEPIRRSILFAGRLCLLACAVVVSPLALAKSCSVAQGQLFIDQGRYDSAIREFSCIIDAAPAEVDGYRGRIEAELMLGRFSDAVRDYARLTARVIPMHPDAASTIYAGYDDRLAAAPTSITALTGSSFAHWWFFDYPGAIHQLDDLLALRTNDVYGNLFRGSSRVLHNSNRAKGVADLERALALAPKSPDVHYVVSDAYTYGIDDPSRAYAEASFALAGGLDTPRVHAILAAALLAFGDEAGAAAHLARHFELVTTELVSLPPLAVGASVAFAIVPGRAVEIPLVAAAGETLAVITSSPDHSIWDSICVLLAPDGTPVTGGDDTKGYMAGFSWMTPVAGTFRLRVTSFEAVLTGTLAVARN
jgi:hypothetical protein